MSKSYYLLLKKLKDEIKIIEEKKKKHKWKKHQKVMIDFINGATSEATYTHNNHSITLFEGDSKKGFMHILLRHYKQNDLETMDIVNIFDIFIRGVEVPNQRNNNLVVYMKLSNQRDLRLVIKRDNENSWVVTAYKKN